MGSAKYRLDSNRVSQSMTLPIEGVTYNCNSTNPDSLKLKPIAESKSVTAQLDEKNKMPKYAEPLKVCLYLTKILY